MKFSDIKHSVTAQFLSPRGNEIVPFIIGAPGGGKSACARAIARGVLQKFGVPYVEYDSGSNNAAEATVVEFNAALRDPVDVLGLPVTDGQYARWTPPAEFYALRAGRGPRVLILEELSDAPVPMQNALCRVIYDRHAGQLQLSDQLYIIATGNSTEHKSGANRIVSKLAGRTRRFDFTENIDDWTEWALDNGIDPVLIQFLRFRPNLLSDFDPNRFANPTPRTWEKVSLIPDSLPEQLYFDNVAGDVGEGAAAEYTGFRRIYKSLPNIDALLLDPTGADVPSDPATKYALAGALARKATPDNFDRISTYLSRMEPEFNVMAVRDAIKLNPDIMTTRSFTEWASKNAQVLM
jgi:hypothetical protein